MTGTTVDCGPSWTVGQVLKLTGFTRRKLQWLGQKGMLERPVRHRRRGRPVARPARLYSAREVLDALLVARLREKHVTLADSRRVLAQLRREGMPETGYIALSVVPVSLEESNQHAPRIAQIAVFSDVAGVTRHLEQWSGSGLVVEIPRLPEGNELDRRRRGEQ